MRLSEGCVNVFILWYDMHTVDVTVNAATDADRLTGVPEDVLVDGKGCLDPVAFVAVKNDVEVSRTLLFHLCLMFCHHNSKHLALKP